MKSCKKRKVAGNQKLQKYKSERMLVFCMHHINFFIEIKIEIFITSRGMNPKKSYK